MPENTLMSVTKKNSELYATIAVAVFIAIAGLLLSTLKVEPRPQTGKGNITATGIKAGN